MVELWWRQTQNCNQSALTFGYCTADYAMFDFPESGDVGYEQKVDRQFFKLWLLNLVKP